MGTQKHPKIVDPVAALYAELKKRVGETQTGSWHTVSPKDVRDFGKVTHNKQFIHTNKKRAQKDSPYGELIAHAYLALALIPHLTSSMRPLSQDPIVNLNYGFNRVRFPEATRIGIKLRAKRTVLSATKREKGVLVKQAVTIQQKGLSRPTVSAESLLFLLPL